MQELLNLNHVIEDGKPKVVLTFKKENKIFSVGFDNPSIKQEDELDKQIAWAVKEMNNWQI